MPRKTNLQTARAVLRHGDHFLLAVHSSFWARRQRRWGLIGGRIERAESPVATVHREIEEELYVDGLELIEIGVFTYKRAQHVVYGGELRRRVSDYDEQELLDLDWYTQDEVADLGARGRLHAGYELEAIQDYLSTIAQS